MTIQPAPQPIPSNDPLRIGEIRTLLGVPLRWNGSTWQKVTANG
ncbi:hypothetical protein [Methylobacterium longum]|uniref:Uncharacterized protein n=1 Tax=Methylobacterium longum TaxID=767694 RepID=A0ABT8ARL9_9HYPH|nr:hypothetical protein [Methylobacterium longum]MDN3572090.1 hypothetical protein [Methylobacterium longum]GJE11072.1 hypothetical protein FOHLNKBM_2110 [Methylobacterium longum]